MDAIEGHAGHQFYIILPKNVISMLIEAYLVAITCQLAIERSNCRASITAMAAFPLHPLEPYALPTLYGESEAAAGAPETLIS